MEPVLKFTSSRGNIFFIKDKDMPGGFIGAKRYLNSRFLETGTFEEYLFNKDNVSDASQEEADMFHQLMNRSTFLIGNL